jgi:hypothetical protein
MSSLTTLARFKAYAGITGTAQDAVITALIPQVGSQIERYLRRTLAATTYKVWLDGTGTPHLRLGQYPVLAVYQVSTGSSTVATVENTSAAVGLANVSCDGTSLSLVEMSSLGVEKITDITLAGKTIATLKTAVELVAGWGMTILSTDWENKAAALLRPLYGQDALSPSTADVVVPDKPAAIKVVIDDAITLVSPAPSAVWRNYAPTAPSDVEWGFPTGIANVFCWYKAGYVLPTDAVDGPPAVAASDGTLPPGLALVGHQILSDVLGSIQLNSNMQSESIGDYSYTLRATDKGAVASAVENRKKDLNQYRRVSI